MKFTYFIVCWNKFTKLYLEIWKSVPTNFYEFQAKLLFAISDSIPIEKNIHIAEEAIKQRIEQVNKNSFL
jgi:hypothetical protein